MLFRSFPLRSGRRFSSRSGGYHRDHHHFSLLKCTDCPERFLQISPQHTTVNFGTFHSCFYQILLRSGRVSPGNILNEKQKKELIYPVLKKIKAHNALSATDLPELAKNLLTAIGYYKNTGDLQSSKIGRASCRERV